MAEHGNGAKPYDCNLCTEKFFFRAELENHLFEHDNGRIKIAPDELSNKDLKLENANERMIIPKSEINDDEEEYIEVEKVLETSMNSESPVENRTTEVDNNVNEKCDQN